MDSAQSFFNDPQTWFKANPWGYILGGLLLIALLYVQGGPFGAIGTLGLTAIALIAIVYWAKHKQGA